MKRGKDIAAEFDGLYLVHQNIPGKKVNQFTHPCHILFIPLQGEIKVVLKNEYSLGPGHMLFLPANSTHSFDSSTLAGERLIAMINPRTNSAIKIPVNDGPVILPLSQLIKELLFYLLLHPQTSNAISLVSVMIETLTENLNSYGKHMELSTEHLSGKIKDTRIRKAVGLMQDHIGEKISIEEIAKKSGLSSRNLNRLMLQEIGLSPKQFLITARIEYAQKLLLMPGASVTDVALSVGYSSLSQFISIFRSQTGQLPSEVARIGRKPKL